MSSFNWSFFSPMCSLHFLTERHWEVNNWLQDLFSTFTADTMIEYVRTRKSPKKWLLRDDEITFHLLITANFCNILLIFAHLSHKLLVIFCSVLSLMTGPVSATTQRKKRVMCHLRHACMHPLSAWSHIMQPTPTPACNQVLWPPWISKKAPPT